MGMALIGRKSTGQESAFHCKSFYTLLFSGSP
jgi:hypothetical protein